jgi:hypothetical protein
MDIIPKIPVKTTSLKRQIAVCRDTIDNMSTSDIINYIHFDLEIIQNMYIQIYKKIIITYTNKDISENILNILEDSLCLNYDKDLNENLSSKNIIELRKIYNKIDKCLPLCDNLYKKLYNLSF